MTAVSDTSPINYLVWIDEIHLLPTLFEKILIPDAVRRELLHPKTSLKVRNWISNPPHWLEIRQVTSLPTPAVMLLDPGEREAILLGLELGLNTMLIDETRGRKQAELLHLEVRGTLGILERGARLGHINFRQALRKLEETPFRISPAVRSAFLQRNP